eukprot:3884070-Rhodomonas_salina.3
MKEDFPKLRGEGVQRDEFRVRGRCEQGRGRKGEAQAEGIGREKIRHGGQSARSTFGSCFRRAWSGSVKRLENLPWILSFHEEELGTAPRYDDDQETTRGFESASMGIDCPHFTPAGSYVDSLSFFGYSCREITIGCPQRSNRSSSERPKRHKHSQDSFVGHGWWRQHRKDDIGLRFQRGGGEREDESRQQGRDHGGRVPPCAGGSEGRGSAIEGRHGRYQKHHTICLGQGRCYGMSGTELRCYATRESIAGEHGAGDACAAARAGISLRDPWYWHSAGLRDPRY